MSSFQVDRPSSPHFSAVFASTGAERALVREHRSAAKTQLKGGIGGRVDQMRPPLKYTRGYTLVELMMAVTVFAIGVVGVIAMQKVTASSNQHAKSIATATHIAQSWIDELNADAVQWNHPSARSSVSDINDTIWLSNVATANTEWRRPDYSTTRDFGPAFDALGNVVNPGTNPKHAKFCTHIRLSWLYPPTATVRGNGLIRAEVRVFWLRSDENALDNRQICDPALKTADVAAATDRYHFVYKVAAIRQNNAI